MAWAGVRESSVGAIRKLQPMTGGIQPITGDEHCAHREGPPLTRENKLGAIVLEGGSNS